MIQFKNNRQREKMQTEKQNIPESFQIAEMEYAYESEMQSAWDRLPNGVSLRLNDGSTAVILSHGIWNLEAGPDFLNAKIMRNGRIMRGDIELHRKSSDFIRHGHLEDPAYSDVILHVVSEDDLANDPSAPLRELPVYIMHDGEFEAILANPPKGSCCRIFPFMEDAELCSFFTDAGVERMYRKSEAVLANMIASGSSYGFLERLFSAAGYKNNSIPFRDLLTRYMKYPEEIRREHFRAILWGESGMLPDPSREILPPENVEYAKTLWNEFWTLRLRALPQIEWRRDSVRPANTPERRLAMICALIERFTEDPLPAFSEDLASMDSGAFLKKYMHLFQCSDGFWDRRFTFRSEPLNRPLAVLSASRSRTFLVDVLMPSLLAYAKLHSDEALTEAALRFLKILPATESNTVFRNALKTWFRGGEARMEKLFSSAVMRQGCIHIYKNYCEETAADCESCLLANS